jgi:hypothetical protein
VNSHPTDGFPPWRRIVGIGLLALLGLPGCGPRGADDVGPLFIETDALVRDIDGDGLSDIITLGWRSISSDRRYGILAVYRQISPGVFAERETYTIGDSPSRLVAGDLNGDGLLDLVLSDDSAHAAWLMLQSPFIKGHFQPAQQIAGGKVGDHLAIADLDRDGRLDVIICDSDVLGLLLLYQNPASPGTFLPGVALTLPGEAYNVAAGDLNGDGLVDLAAYVYTQDIPPVCEIMIAFQQPGGGFGPPTSVAHQTYLNGDLLSVFDYNGDGRQDLIAHLTPYDGSKVSRIMVVLQGLLPGTFETPVETLVLVPSGDAFGYLGSAAVADLDGDGRPDVAVGGFYFVGDMDVRSRVVLYLQSGGGAFTLTTVFKPKITVGCVGAGDVDGDGRNDLVIYGNERVQVMIQSHTVPGTFEEPISIP